ncbi:unnamed protein product [Colletotrichum noveboracense]|nr:unnamed protein product [Colletotrichum noveboracense]
MQKLDVSKESRDASDKGGKEARHVDGQKPTISNPSSKDQLPGRGTQVKVRAPIMGVWTLWRTTVRFSKYPKIKIVVPMFLLRSADPQVASSRMAKNKQA